MSKMKRKGIFFIRPQQEGPYMKWSAMATQKRKKPKKPRPAPPKPDTY